MYGSDRTRRRVAKSLFISTSKISNKLAMTAIARHHVTLDVAWDTIMFMLLTRYSYTSDSAPVRCYHLVNRLENTPRCVKSTLQLMSRFEHPKLTPYLSCICRCLHCKNIRISTDILSRVLIF